LSPGTAGNGGRKTASSNDHNLYSELCMTKVLANESKVAYRNKFLHFRRPMPICLGIGHSIQCPIPGPTHLDFGGTLPLSSLPSLLKVSPISSHPLDVTPPPLPKGVWAAHKLSQRVGAEPDRQPYIGTFLAQIQPFDCLMTNNFLYILLIKRKFPRYICNSLSRPKKDLEHTIQQPLGREL